MHRLIEANQVDGVRYIFLHTQLDEYPLYIVLLDDNNSRVRSCVEDILTDDLPHGTCVNIKFFTEVHDYDF